VRTYKTEGIILSRRNFSENDRILTILTRRYGKIKAIAKGVRKIKSKKAPYLDQLSYANLLLSKGKDLDLIIEASSIETFSRITKNLYVIATALFGAELVDYLTVERVENQKLFLLFRDFLREASREKEKVRLDLLRFAFEIKLLFMLGFWLPKQFKIESREKEIFSQLLTVELAVAKKMQIENPKKIDLILKREIENIIEKKLKSPEILSDYN